MFKKLTMVSLMSLALTACEGAGPKERIGTVLGAVGGAVVGAQVGKGSGRDVAIAAGALLGAILGSEAGKSLDRADRLAMQQATNQALENQPSGTSTTWHNPDSGNSGTVTPTRTYKDASSSYCREYEQTIYVGGREETARGTACRQSDGTWKIVE